MLKRIMTSDQNIQLIQDNVDAALVPLQSGLMTGAVVIKNVHLTSGQDNLIAHNLNRVPQIFFVGNLDKNTPVWAQTSASLANQSSNSTHINLRCSTSCTILLWIN